MNAAQPMGRLVTPRQRRMPRTVNAPRRKLRPKSLTASAPPLKPSPKPRTANALRRKLRLKQPIGGALTADHRPRRAVHHAVRTKLLRLRGLKNRAPNSRPTRATKGNSATNARRKTNGTESLERQQYKRARCLRRTLFSLVAGNRTQLYRTEILGLFRALA